MGSLKIVCALAVLATAGSTFAIETYPLAAHAQTQGMKRRGERRDTRHEFKGDEARVQRRQRQVAIRVSAGEARREADGPAQWNANDRHTALSRA